MNSFDPALDGVCRKRRMKRPMLAAPRFLARRQHAFGCAGRLWGFRKSVLIRRERPLQISLQGGWPCPGGLEPASRYMGFPAAPGTTSIATTFPVGSLTAVPSRGQVAEVKGLKHSTERCAAPREAEPTQSPFFQNLPLRAESIYLIGRNLLKVACARRVQRSLDFASVFFRLMAGNLAWRKIEFKCAKSVDLISCHIARVDSITWRAC